MAVTLASTTSEYTALVLKVRLKPPSFTSSEVRYDHKPEFNDADAPSLPYKMRSTLTPKVEVFSLSPEAHQSKSTIAWTLTGELSDFYDALTEACRKVVQNEYHSEWTRRWMMCNRIDDVAVCWDYKEDPTETMIRNAGGGGITVLHENNFDEVLCLLRDRKGKDVLVLSTKDANNKIPTKEPVPPSPPLAPQTTRGKVSFQYEAFSDSDEISLVQGEYITNISAIDENWSHGTNSLGKSGLFPINFVEVVADVPAPPPRPHSHTPELGSAQRPVYIVEHYERSGKKRGLSKFISHMSSAIRETAAGEGGKAIGEALATAFSSDGGGSTSYNGGGHDGGGDSGGGGGGGDGGC